MQAFAGSSGGLAFQKFTNDRSVNVGEASLNPVMIDAQSSVIQSNQVKECGMKIMGGNHFFSRLITEWIRGSMAVGGLNASACHEGCKPLWIVVASASTLLKRRHPSKFSAPYHKCMLE